MANRWGNNGNSDRLYSGGSKFTADGDCSHEIKRCLFLGRKAMTNLDSILKSRDITLPTEVCLVKAMIFPEVMYGCENWTIKKAECLRIDAFDLWYWRRLLRVPWTARRSSQSILKEISPEYSLEGLMLKLKLQYFGHLMGRTDSFEKILMLGKIEGRRRRRQLRVRWLDGISDEMRTQVGIPLKFPSVSYIISSSSRMNYFDYAFCFSLILLVCLSGDSCWSFQVCKFKIRLSNIFRKLV